MLIKSSGYIWTNNMLKQKDVKLYVAKHLEIPSYQLLLV